MLTFICLRPSRSAPVGINSVRNQRNWGLGALGQLPYLQEPPHNSVPTQKSPHMLCLLRATGSLLQGETRGTLGGCQRNRLRDNARQEVGRCRESKDQMGHLEPPSQRGGQRWRLRVPTRNSVSSSPGGPYPQALTPPPESSLLPAGADGGVPAHLPSPKPGTQSASRPHPSAKEPLFGRTLGSPGL